METFAPKLTLDERRTDPWKHVHYVQGMVLGVDDFEAEHAFLSERDRLLARDLLGYGTVVGLRVTYNEARREVEVAPGTALTPRGEFVRVTKAQCADLPAWLADHQQDLADLGQSPPDPLRLYVVLAYRECPTDRVPVPGEPCRSDDTAMAASRLADDFELDLQLEAPDQTEEDALRDFVAWLRQVTTVAATGVSPDEFMDALRAAGLDATAPADDFMHGSPPDFPVGSPPEPVEIPADRLSDYLRAAFRLWTTELRPAWLGHGANAAGAAPDEHFVLLATLDLPLTQDDGDWILDPAGDLTIDESRRPYLLHLRMIQEWLLHGRQGGATGVLAGEVTGPLEDTRVAGLQGIGVAGPDGGAEGDVLTISGGLWRATPPRAAPGLPDLAGDVTGTIVGNTVERIRGTDVDPTAPTPAQVLTAFDDNGTVRWRPADPPPAAGPTQLGGDVTGDATANTIQNIQGVGVDARAPGAGQVLAAFDAGGGTLQWRPADPAAAGPTPLRGDVTGTTDANTVEAIQGVTVVPASPSDGQVLTFRNNRWRPAAVVAPQGPFVEHPPQLQPFFIVAAGLVSVRGSVSQPLYDQSLALVDLGNADGGLLLSFDDYRNPFGQRFTYVVKAVPGQFTRGANADDNVLSNLSSRQPLVVNFVGFAAEGIVLQAFFANGEPVVELVNLMLMVEVSFFESP